MKIMLLHWQSAAFYLSLIQYIGLISAQNSGDQIPMDGSGDWATRHMLEEHGIGSFDAASFFALHDYDSSGFWTSDDILRTYGLMDESAKDVSEQTRQEVVNKILGLFDIDKSSTVSSEEFLAVSGQGIKMPDFGLVPGHHGDDEYEYEIHHFDKYHDENTQEEDLIHPEDIEHFKKHEAMLDDEEALEKLSFTGVNENNIPAKFRRSK